MDRLTFTQRIKIIKTYYKNDDCVAEDLNVSIPLPSQEFRLFYCTLDLQLHPYKVQPTQQLKAASHSQRRKYLQWVLEQQTVDGDI